MVVFYGNIDLELKDLIQDDHYNSWNLHVSFLSVMLQSSLSEFEINEAEKICDR